MASVVNIKDVQIKIPPYLLVEFFYKQNVFLIIIHRLCNPWIILSMGRIDSMLHRLFPFMFNRETRGGASPLIDSISTGDAHGIEDISDHIERHIGPIDSVFHELISPEVHIDVHIVAANAERPFHTLVTSGMSEIAMPVPKEIVDYQYAEVMICLPKEWPILAIKATPAKGEELNHWWPVRTLRFTARYPHLAKTWLYLDHTLGNEKERPYAPSTQMCATILANPKTIKPMARTMRSRNGKRIQLWAVVPIYQEELDLKLKRGAKELNARFEKHGINEILDPSRINVALEA